MYADDFSITCKPKVTLNSITANFPRFVKRG
jgi:hypothetical protein